MQNPKARAQESPNSVFPDGIAGALAPTDSLSNRQPITAAKNENCNISRNTDNSRTCFPVDGGQRPTQPHIPQEKWSKRGASILPLSQEGPRQKKGDGGSRTLCHGAPRVRKLQPNEDRTTRTTAFKLLDKQRFIMNTNRGQEGRHRVIPPQWARKKRKQQVETEHNHHRLTKPKTF